MCRVGLACLLSASLAPTAPAQAAPQEPAAAPAPGAARELADAVLESVTPYVSLRIRMANVDQDTELQNGASRAGLLLRRELDAGFAVTGQVELGLNLVENNLRITPSEVDGSVLLGRSAVDPVSTRLGWVGFDFGDLGELTFGKQWGVYYDVAGWTDALPVFGGAALGVYTAGGDGGAIGTGRAEQAAAWRVTRGPWTLGLQKQVQNLDAAGAEGWGVSLRCAVRDDLTLGAAYNNARLSDAVEQFLGTDDHAQALVVGCQWTHDDAQLAASYARLWDHELALLDPANDVFALWGGNGVEVYGRVRLAGGLHALAALNVLTPQDAPVSLPPGYGIEDWFLGLDYCFDAKTKVYVVGRLSDTVAETGLAQGDALVVGVQLDF